ncbi:hypothetical protein [Vreelandella populi]|uniref:DUF2171 domain-containing protein n=1 Tax=Vreelandella populi TaxID=2498858 RepID=A0A3S0WIJ8_9GAMM|nr:hypothetical protein [Halomonas populi]RUR36472.1 hypothetical protein ELY25_12455 [Halomonas populi]RUR44932.1 hypothetical protein ELY37_12680 [Halomonas populi]RUR51266.1 hypothetical protein ELY40_15730 [Halomonas populi]
MAQSELQDATIYTQDGSTLGTVSDASAETKVELKKADGSCIWLERHDLKEVDGQWQIADNYTVYSADQMNGGKTESDIDEMVDDTFPASDPPSFTLGDEGKGR